MNLEIYSAVDMTRLGISTVVLAKHERLDWYLNEYRTQPDHLFGGGVGKKKLFSILKHRLPIEDSYFNQNPLEAIEENQRWSDFCEDCIIFATLNAFMNQVPVTLIHPASYDPEKKFNSAHAAITKIPTFIEGILTTFTTQSNTTGESK